MNYRKTLASLASVALLLTSAPAYAGGFDNDEAELPYAEKMQRLQNGERIFFGDSRHGDIVRWNRLTSVLTVTTVIRPHGHNENTVSTVNYCSTDGLRVTAFTPGSGCVAPMGPVQFTHTTNGNATLGRSLAAVIPTFASGMSAGLGQALSGIIHNPCADGCGGTYNISGGDGGTAMSVSEADASNATEVGVDVDLNTGACTTGACPMTPPTVPQHPGQDAQPPEY